MGLTPWLQDTDCTLYHGDCLEVLRELPSGSVHMCATSPPFYGLRDYQTDGQIGLEETPDQWVERLVAVFREVRRVLRDDGTLWVEIGDSYTAGKQGRTDQGRDIGGRGGNYASGDFALGEERKAPPGYKPKDLLGQPWLLAFALRADGWWLRSEIIWARPNPMPESVTDRPTKAHSTVFLLSKQPRYFYDADAIRTPLEVSTLERAYAYKDPKYVGPKEASADGNDVRGHAGWQGKRYIPSGANARSVWTIPTEPTPFAHFATWPQALVRRMILAGTSERGCCPECGAPWVRETANEPDPSYGTRQPREAVDQTGMVNGQSWNAHRTYAGTKAVTTLGWSPSCAHDTEPVPCTALDPFAGSGTTSLVARNHGRHSIGIELNESYLEIAARRLQQLSLLA